MIKRFRAVQVVTGAAVAGVLVGAPMSTQALSQCDPADYTVGGVFDLDGYLACGAGAGGGGLPATGGNNLQIIGVAAGVLAIGVGMFVTARRSQQQHEAV